METTTWDSLSATELAQALGVVKSTITQWKRAGCPCGDDGRYKLKLVVEWLIGREKKKSKPSESRAEKALVEYRRSKTRLAKLEYEKRKNRLVPIDWIVSVVAQSITDSRVQLEQIPDNLGVLLPDDTLRTMIVGEARRAINGSLRAQAKGLRNLLERNTNQEETNDEQRATIPLTG